MQLQSSHVHSVTVTQFQDIKDLMATGHTFEKNAFPKIAFEWFRIVAIFPTGKMTSNKGFFFPNEPKRPT